ncbi:polyamine-transporting ATPase 13A3-like isoform X1 [Vespa crabro]|uniref:polyamine-transporting ATPase 13A3-like isoform X1 n=1 Tax=Vespa crabro TaxID=7445 RepID=UPI001F006763|nr:polyamine-transporting ATPase 13A3-like isoform X1 [Vespa crabro]XP_046814650.1 polyamine-transporting ATPase 13A3-like isoform X1 [Vespa crabro]XP_046814651.1 polyamine-transporting ATPase 13A3-like isoform X1 [Vespa crabro]XP_046814652.1 polyamine-transporting ATPase 13A3-like isoform X1 [Vespa crabro]XP_046814653.1 polyamine-transporting ATPase 13A3-like isoform X1 [Vespa crabro]XP_046814654.1 polyamine-transporting ATPase 13A3-like isoform X1 [Vespa crabro]
MSNSNAIKKDEQSKIDCQKIQTGQDEDIQVYGFKRSTLKTIIIYISYILTVGFVRLLFHWYPRLYLYATHRKCPLKEATKLLVIDDYQGRYKSYFVKNIKTISTENVSDKSFSSILGSNSINLLESVRNKKLKLNLENGTKSEVTEYKAFWCKKQCYIWDVTQNAFSKLVGFDKYMLCSDLHLGQNKGLSKEEQFLRRIVYGNNEIVVPVQSIGVLLLLEVLNPFYIFQVFTLAVWFAEEYLYYTIAIICMSVFGITSSILQTRKNQLNLKGTVASFENVRVYRSSGIFESISSNELVPGDIIELPNHHGTVVCDAVLLTGQCIINESMLTGESVPVSKTPLPSNQVPYDSKQSSHHTLYSGTTIIQTRCYGNKPVLARVIRTGLQTNRGALVAAILYPPPADFKFDQDSYKFIGILACVATCGFIYTVVTKASRGITAGDIAIKALDIITIVVPPALPAAMTVGKLYAQARLKRTQIYCINNRVINVSGSINCVCFDKTGTLTEDGLDMWGVVPCTNGNLEESEKNIPKLQHHPLFEGMLVCHSLNIINGKLCGDPLDVKMFESTEWILEESDTTQSDKYDLVAPTVVKPPKDNNFTKNMNKISEIGIVQQYQFSSSLQRMSVIVRILGSNHFKAYTKGSPEMIFSLSKPETLPKNIITTLKTYTEQGYRVIAIGQSTIIENGAKVSKMTRDEVEQNLEFLGLIILENRLKEPTVSVIKELREANMHVIMITGDNIQTAVSVAKECGILLPNETVIDVVIVPNQFKKTQPEIFFNAQNITPKLNLQGKKHMIPMLDDMEQGIDIKNYRFALTGQTWQLLKECYPDIVPKICVRGAIFARMTSDQKQQLVLELMQLGYYVVMCGDGANDCGALRAAHAGVSLSEAESSVASPFTSRIPDITCIPKVIRQGRAALVTSFGIFKFMVAYSLTEFLSVIILYSIDSNLTDLEFLFIDIFLIVNFASFFGKTQAYEKKLAKDPPMTSLLSFTPLLSLTVHMLIMTTFQAIAYHTVRYFPWFTPFVHTSNIGYTCYENYSVFCVSMFQYITMAIIFSRGKPYRQPIYTNGMFTFSIVLLISICVYITVYPANWVINLLQLLVPPDYNWRIIILVLALANFFICLIVETLIIEYAIEKKLMPKLHRPEKSKKHYLRVEYELHNNPNWPKLDNELPVLPITPSVENIIKTMYLETSECPNTVNNQKYNEQKVLKRLDDIRKNGVDNQGFVEDALIENVSIITRF